MDEDATEPFLKEKELSKAEVGNILTKDQFHEMKKKIDKNENNNINENILEESGELKDSFCDNILENIKKFREGGQNDE